MAAPSPSGTGLQLPARPAALRLPPCPARQPPPFEPWRLWHRWRWRRCPRPGASTSSPPVSPPSATGPSPRAAPARPTGWRRPASCTAPARTAPTWRSASSASRSWRAGSPTTTRWRSTRSTLPAARLSPYRRIPLA